MGFGSLKSLLCVDILATEDWLCTQFLVESEDEQYNVTGIIIVVYIIMELDKFRMHTTN